MRNRPKFQDSPDVAGATETASETAAETATDAASPSNADVNDSARLNTKDMRRILASSFIGSAVEYYDFILYSVAAALVFNQTFFSGLGPGFALFASFATLAIGYVVRPVGGIVFGHFGDRIGRKKMLVLSMLLMGGATTAIGLLPTTAQAGLIGPIALIVLRLIQGFAVGGEWGGAALMALEHAPAKRRGFAASFANAGGPAGAILATLVVSAFTMAAGDKFLVWGWRVPFLISAVLIIVGLIIRLKIAESPLFQRLVEKGEKRKMPILDVVRNHPRAVLIALMATISFYCCQGILTVWGVAHAVSQGVDQSGVLDFKALGAAVTLVVTFIAARLSDKVGRRPVLMSAGVAGIVLAFPTIWLLDNGTLWGFAIADIVGNGVVQGFLYGPIGAYIAEQFPTRLRYSGASLSYQGASMIGAGFTPMIASGLVIVGGGSPWLVAVFWMAVLLAGLLAVRATPEGVKVNLG
ncbi:MFS transporter [Spelaeicoccus albus]|uniref:MFS family permease n=1 Tax=Spelaeicoccus albus TaxID=1280376 RepID=A0A7Z0D1U3_9MICO|nr:MFS transporter [Spelaeicoccus albus]NYI66912.1 MFS family permease [Spelaeicoccus albus]